jgi:hypothetical protein
MKSVASKIMKAAAMAAQALSMAKARAASMARNIRK